jgi:hypothetical protein
MFTEIFGPVAAILTFEDEVVRRANDTDWGLVGYVFTRSLDRALRVTELWRALCVRLFSVERATVRRARAEHAGELIVGGPDAPRCHLGQDLGQPWMRSVAR